MRRECGEVLRCEWDGVEEYLRLYEGSMDYPIGEGQKSPIPFDPLRKGKWRDLPSRPHPKSSSSLSLGGLGVTKLMRK